MRRNSPGPAGWALAAGYLALGVALASRYMQHINPDGISYLAVAQHIAAGRAAEAVNGYWGPLLSWLLAPLLAVGVGPLVAGRVVDLAAGLAALWGAGRVGTVAGLERRSVVALQAALLPSLALNATVNITPDMLFLAVWLHYVALVHRPGFGSRASDALMAGLLGALGYLAKPYGFYVFGLHFLLCCAWRWLAAPAHARRAVFMVGVAGFACFAALAGPWMATLGHKYGGLPVSTSGPYNRALFAPNSKGQPLEHMGFVAPVNAQATSAWEDPTGLPLPNWGAVERGAALRHQAGLLMDNARRLVLAVTWANLVALLALPAAVFLVVRARRRGHWLPEAFLPAVMMIYPVGYLLIRVEQRYVWVTTVLGVVLTVAVAQRLAANRGRALMLAALAAVVLGCWFEPLRDLRAGDATTPRVMATVAALKAAPVPPQRLAASGRWPESLAVAWHLGMRFHGVAGGLDAASAAQGLAAQHVDGYLDWTGDGSGAPAGDGWTLLPHGGGDGPRVWVRAAAQP